MRISQRNQASRRPARVKGSLPSPVVAPRRLHRAWHRRPGILVLAGLVLIALLGLGVQQGLQARARNRERTQQQRAVRVYERNLAVLQAPVRALFQEMSRSPEELKAGKLAPEQFKARSDAWVEGFRKLYRELQRRDGEAPAHLQETNALFAQGAVLYVDAAKAFRSAALATEPAVRDLALEQGKTLIYHAGVVFGNGLRALEHQKHRLEMAGTERSVLDGPVLVPEENVPAQPALPGG